MRDRVLAVVVIPIMPFIIIAAGLTGAWEPIKDWLGLWTGRQKF